MQIATANGPMQVRNQTIADWRDPDYTIVAIPEREMATMAGMPVVRLVRASWKPVPR